MTYLVQAPPYLIAYIVTLVVSWSSGRFLEHCWHIVVPILVTLAGAVLMISTLNIGARYFSLILLCTGPFVGLNVSVRIISFEDQKIDAVSRSKSHGRPRSSHAHVQKGPPWLQLQIVWHQYLTGSRLTSSSLLKNHVMRLEAVSSLQAVDSR